MPCKHTPPCTLYNTKWHLFYDPAEPKHGIGIIDGQFVKFNYKLHIGADGADTAYYTGYLGVGYYLNPALYP